VVEELGVKVVQAHQQQFCFVENLGKISKNLGKKVSTFLTSFDVFYTDCINKSLLCHRKYVIYI